MCSVRRVQCDDVVLVHLQNVMGTVKLIIILYTLTQLFACSLSQKREAMFAKLFNARPASAATSVAQQIVTPTDTDKFRAALFGLYVADATAMPVHWMYNLAQLKRDYGRITSFVKPKDKFEGSILNLSNTGGGGRGSDQGDIVGSVILHGKKKYWLRGGNYHYHLGLEAGENTLEAQLCRVLTQSILETSASVIPPSPTFSAPHFTEKYMQFMQTPGTHNDTYASTAHRMFFANVVRGKPPHECADNDGHNTDAIDALTLTVPVILAYAQCERSVRNAKVREVILITRRSKAVMPYAEKYADILVAGKTALEFIYLFDLLPIINFLCLFCFYRTFRTVLQGTSIRAAIDASDSDGSIRRMAQSSAPDPMVACYIDSSFPAMLVFAYRYADSVEQGILASANAGGTRT